MKAKLPHISLLLALTLPALPVFATEETSTNSQPAASITGTTTKFQKEMGDLVARIQAKINEGHRAEERFTEELKEFNELIERHSAEKSEEVGSAILLQSLLYFQILDNEKKGMALVDRVIKEYPDSPPGKRAQSIKTAVLRQNAIENARPDLQVGKPFPDFNVLDLDGKPLSVSRFKGKPVLVDFWATWCPPCIAELPHIKEAYKEYHDDGFEIISISLDRELEKLTTFIKKEEITWPQHFDKDGRVAAKYDVTTIPTTYLIDAEGNIAAKNLRGNQLSQELARLLGKTE